MSEPRRTLSYVSDLDDVRRLAEALIAQHLPPGWEFGYDHARRRAGATHFTHHRITLSRHLTAKYDDETNRQTLLHEIAHAQVGHEVGHGRAWLIAARRLGYTGGVRHQGEAAIELAPWLGRCPAGHVLHRFRRPTRELSCGRCSRSFDRAHLVVWTRREIA